MKFFNKNYFLVSVEIHRIVSFLRKQESQEPLQNGIPVYAGMTISVDYTYSTRS